MQRTNLELESYKEKIKENQEKIKLNKQLPYLVGNIVEVGYFCVIFKVDLGFCWEILDFCIILNEYSGIHQSYWLF